MAFIIPLVLILGLIAWELYISEGTHLGRRFVVWLYDLAALRYDGIKKFDPAWEWRFLGSPLHRLMSDLPDARLLDVGAGTGRTARTLASSPLEEEPLASMDPRLMVGIEPSREMLSLGRSHTDERFEWVQGWADPLPIATGSMDVVVCLEVLEFTPDPRSSLQEMARVLRPGGWLLTSNRVGWQARLILGKTFSPARFTQVLQKLGFEQVEIVPWQVDYDMAWARKAWT